ncbi:MAG: winged helix-turn-helix transcriptional regulator [Dehalococcoidia bacterium]|nr:MAG: winged helix-turn-helix transcriptional regulator [Dehalococcoidia bacterium]
MEMVDIYSEIFELRADICKTLAQPKRLMIIRELRESRKSVGQLTSSLGLSQPNISQHLSKLRERGIVETQREGTTVYYSLASPKIAEACDLVHKLLEEQLKKGEELVRSLSRY